MWVGGKVDMGKRDVGEDVTDVVNVGGMPI